MALVHLPRRSLRGEECAECLVQLCDKARPLAPVDRTFPLIINRCDFTVEIAHQAFGNMRSHPLTAVVAQKDEVRDDIYRRAAKLIGGMRSSYDPVKSQAAEALYLLFKKHDIHLASESRAVESSKLKALFSDLETEDAVKAIEQLEIVTMIADLKKAEQEFFDAHQQLISAKAGDSGPPASEVTPLLRRCLYLITEYAAILDELEPDYWKNMTGEFNEIITEFAAKARARRTRAESEKEEEEEEEPVGDEPPTLPPSGEEALVTAPSDSDNGADVAPSA